MPGETHLLTRRLNIYHTVIEIASNSRRRLEALERLLCLPRGGEDGPAQVRLKLLETEESAAGRIIPLPGNESRCLDTFILLDQKIPYQVFVQGDLRWTNLPGFGRMRVDCKQGDALAVFYPGGGFSPFYADLLFGLNMLNELLLKEGFCSIHASCVQVGQTGIIFTGPSGSGKSTAAFALARRGHPLLNDERVLLYREEGGFRCFTLSDVVKLDCAALTAFFPELAAMKPLIELNQERYYKASVTAGLRHVPTATPRSLIVFKRTGRRESVLEQINPVDVVRDLFPVTMPGFNPQAASRKFEILLDFLQQVRCRRLLFGTAMDRFAGLIEGIAGDADRN